MKHDDWKNEAINALKQYFNTNDFEYEYDFYNGISVKYTGDDYNIHDYVIFKNYETAKDAAIQSQTELLEDVYSDINDIDALKKYIDINKCYTLSDETIHIMAEDIISYSPNYDIFDIIKELKENPLKTLDEYSDIYIWHNENHSWFNIDYKKCAELSVEKFGLASVLDNYYGKNEYKLDGGFIAYPI